VALLFRQYGLVAAPVTDGEGRLLGVLTIDDVVTVIDAEAEEDLIRLGGVSEIDLYDNVMRVVRGRFAWLVVNLLTAVAASMVIGAFQGTTEKLVALAVLMPIVAAMGGNAGTQTVTVAVRALAMRELTSINALRFVLRETLVGSVNAAASRWSPGRCLGFGSTIPWSRRSWPRRWPSIWGSRGFSAGSSR